MSWDRSDENWLMLMGKNGDKPLMMMFIMVYLGTF
jgi:hypothetical protein